MLPWPSSQPQDCGQRASEHCLCPIIFQNNDLWDGEMPRLDHLDGAECVVDGGRDLGGYTFFGDCEIYSGIIHFVLGMASNVSALMGSQD